ncbi:hypothetical protein HO173_010211 [Letharia columbiana]|uniref:DUF1308 domain-containing protein n=1 Tax=Letharia columbiana TaxID=112416 RepID=A0A8H6FMX3_9LECA|nr:uncharacterized protein HO173_010211 [Letharia columbiana]KAF6231459.1 hypothetical protein HO173_010211 [Letharia columbiana]
MAEDYDSDAERVGGVVSSITNGSATTEAASTEGSSLVEDLLARCQSLVNELEDFKKFVAEQRLEQEPAVDIHKFQTSVATEHKSLQKLAYADLTAEKTIHTLRSSNLPFYAAIWDAAKASKALVTFGKRFYWDNRPTRDSKKAAEKRCALVDIVAHDGEEWIKVSTITGNRLSMEIAKAKWEAADSSSEDEEQENGNSTSDEDDVDRIELMKVAYDLLRASQAHRIHYKHPRIRFVLPKISSSPPPELMPVLERIRSTGAVIDLGDQSASNGLFKESAFPRLLPSPHPPLTDTLNIDCTILLALVSDLSHTANHPILPNYNSAITRQIEMETREHLLPSSLWPAMANKDLVCTHEAAKRMKEIVDTIGMPNEKARTVLLIGDGPARSGNGLREAFAKYSDYAIPSSLGLPIRIVQAEVSEYDLENAIQRGTLPPVALQVAEQLTDINRSVFMYGWMQSMTTVSSNRTVAKQVEVIVERAGNGATGPEIWLREPARSLLGKEKERRK